MRKLISKKRPVGGRPKLEETKASSGGGQPVRSGFIPPDPGKLRKVHTPGIS